MIFDPIALINENQILLTRGQLRNADFIYRCPAHPPYSPLGKARVPPYLLIKGCMNASPSSNTPCFLSPEVNSCLWVFKEILEPYIGFFKNRLNGSSVEISFRARHSRNKDWDTYKYQFSAKSVTWNTLEYDFKGAVKLNTYASPDPAELYLTPLQAGVYQYLIDEFHKKNI